MKRFAFVTSGSGRLLEQVATQSDAVRSALATVITDRPCEAENVARRLGVPLVRLASTKNPDMSDEILAVGENTSVAFFVLLFNRLVGGRLLTRYEHRILNLHPTLLPAFAGLHGLQECLDSGVRFLGCTVHYVDETVDGGPIVLQAAMPNDTTVPVDERRRAQFLQMCKACLQAMEWQSDDRLTVTAPRTVEVRGATYSDPHFSPGLDSPSARNLTLVDLSARRTDR